MRRQERRGHRRSSGVQELRHAARLPLRLGEALRTGPANEGALAATLVAAPPAAAPRVVDRETWLKARLALLTEEKALTHAREALAGAMARW